MTNADLKPISSIIALAMAGDPQSAILVSRLIPMPRPRRSRALVANEVGGIDNFKAIARSLKCAIYAQGSRVLGHWIKTSDYDIGGVDFLKSDQIIKDLENELGIRIDPKKQVLHYAIEIKSQHH